MDIEIREIKTREEIKKFVKFEWEIYKRDKNWVAPMVDIDMDRLTASKNPYFKHSKVKLFMAYRNGKPLGRISAQVDQNYIDFHKEKTGFFGFFESINDRDVAGALFDAALNFLRQNGMEYALGPACFNSNDDEYGLLIDGFDSPPVMGMSYNPPYYMELMQGYGFEKAKDLVAYNISTDEKFRNFAGRLIARLKPLAERAEKSGFKIRNLDFSNVLAEIARVREIYNAAWEANWGFVPMTEDEFNHVANDFKQIAIPELAKIVEYNGEPVAFGLVLPDVNLVLKQMKGSIFSLGIIPFAYHSITKFRNIKGTRLITLGIKKNYRKRGIDSMLYYNMLLDGIALKHMRNCEVSWLLEDNYLIIRAARFMGGKLYKTYRMYGKSL